MGTNSWSDDDVYDWLHRFSLALEETVQTGADTTKEEIVKLLAFLTTFNDTIQRNGIYRHLHRTLKLAQDLLDAALSQHVKNEQNLSHQFSMKTESEVSDIGTAEKIPPEICPTSDVTEISTPPFEPSRSIAKDELDSFSTSRRQAIESTIVTNLDELPKLSEIIGLEEAKTALFEALVDPIQYPEWFVSSDLKPWKAVLLYGPPGTGKSALAQAIVREIKSHLYQVSSSDLISTWSGQSERLIRELFDHAVALNRTAVIFIDEVDSLCRTRCSSEDDANRRVKTELLVQIQRLQSTSRVVLVCATNCPWDLDPAFMRRFEKKIYVGLPDYRSRLDMLKSRLLHTTMDSSVSFEWIAEATNGFSGDDIRRFATELAYTQFRYYKLRNRFHSDPTSRQALSFQDIEDVLSSFSKSVEDHQLARFLEYRNK
ncbi:hypothetical protein V3C99_011818 [Haemonchus contortus]